MPCAMGVTQTDRLTVSRTYSQRTAQRVVCRLLPVITLDLQLFQNCPGLEDISSQHFGLSNDVSDVVVAKQAHVTRIGNSNFKFKIGYRSTK